MLKVQSRAELLRLKGEQAKPEQAAPAPAADLTGLQAAVERVGAQFEQATAAMLACAQPKPTPKKHMEAIVHRDRDGRMQKVTITIQEEK